MTLSQPPSHHRWIFRLDTTFSQLLSCGLKLPRKSRIKVNQHVKPPDVEVAYYKKDLSEQKKRVKNCQDLAKEIGDFAGVARA